MRKNRRQKALAVPGSRRAVAFIRSAVKVLALLTAPSRTCGPKLSIHLLLRFTGHNLQRKLGVMPKRFQVKRTKGWKMPADAIYVGRPTKWGNPFKMSAKVPREKAVALYEDRLRKMAAKDRKALLEPLRGKRLGCWCPPGEPCHADVLLKWANMDCQ